MATFTPSTMTARTPHTPVHDLSDEALVQRMGETGDRTCFGIIYERYQGRVLSRTWHMVGDRAEAQDLTQEVFLRLFKNAAKYKQQSAFAAWFKVLTYNVVIDELRKRQRMQMDPLPDDPSTLSMMEESDQTIREKRTFELLYERLMHLLDRINQEEKELLLMKYRDDIPVKTIATRMRLGESAVKMRLRRSRLKVLALDKELPTDIELRQLAFPTNAAS